jgi:hypothetical protein
MSLKKCCFFAIKPLQMRIGALNEQKKAGGVTGLRMQEEES